MIAMSPAAVVTEVTNMDTSACCSVEDTWRVFQCAIVMVMVAMEDFRTRMTINIPDICHFFYTGKIFGE